MQFATNLKYLRDERKLSNYRLAMDLGCSQSTIKNWISGDNTPHPKMQKTIADYFGITVDALNGDELPILPAQDTKKARSADGEALNVDEWIKKARTMSNGDLNLALRELLKIQAERIAEDERPEH